MAPEESAHGIYYSPAFRVKVKALPYLSTERSNLRVSYVCSACRRLGCSGPFHSGRFSLPSRCSRIAIRTSGEQRGPLLCGLPGREQADLWNRHGAMKPLHAVRVAALSDRLRLARRRGTTPAIVAVELRVQVPVSHVTPDHDWGLEPLGTLDAPMVITLTLQVEVRLSCSASLRG